jgi:hypothetical protein
MCTQMKQSRLPLTESQISAQLQLKMTGVQLHMNDDTCAVTERDDRRPPQVTEKGVGPTRLPHQGNARRHRVQRRRKTAAWVMRR